MGVGALVVRNDVLVDTDSVIRNVPSTPEMLSR